MTPYAHDVTPFPSPSYTAARERLLPSSLLHAPPHTTTQIVFKPLFTFKSHIFIMGKALTKVIYKPDPNAGETFTVIVNPAEVRRFTTAFFRMRSSLVVIMFDTSSSRSGRRVVSTLSLCTEKSADTYQTIDFADT